MLPSKRFKSVSSYQTKIETLQYHENLPTAEAIKVLMDMFHMRETNQGEELHLEVCDEVSSKLNDRDLVSISLMAKDKHMISGMLPIFFVCIYSVHMFIFMPISLA